MHLIVMLILIFEMISIFEHIIWILIFVVLGVYPTDLDDLVELDSHVLGVLTTDYGDDLDDLDELDEIDVW